MKQKPKKFFMAAMCFLIFSHGPFAFAADAKKEAIAKAQEKLQATYGNMVVANFTTGPVPGSFEVTSGGKIIYYFPESELLMFGEFLTRDGRSLTQERLTNQQASKAGQIPLAAAIKVGSGPREIIEFTDPDCPFCRKYEDYIHEQSDVTRYIFFSPIASLHPNAESKAVHILCAKNPIQAYRDVYTDKVALKDLDSCADGRQKLALHQKVSSEFGVSGTPTLVLGKSQVVTGFNQPRIAQYLNANEKGEASK